MQLLCESLSRARVDRSLICGDSNGRQSEESERLHPTAWLKDRRVLPDSRWP